MATSKPLRPSLQRAHFTTNSVPQLDIHERPLVRSIPGFGPTTSTTLSPPYTQTRKGSFGQDSMQTRKPSFGHDMLRTESADSHRSLKQKHSRKELKEMAKSGSPLVTTFQAAAASTKQHKYTRSWEDDGNSNNDDDARSISSFTCSFANEFDAKHKERSEYGNEESSTRQRFLDAVFRKLTQKTGIHKRESRAWAAVEKTIREEQSSSDQAVQSKASKVKQHFLDLSTYISPIPSLPADSNITPRQADIQRFKTTSPPSQLSTTNKERPTLRSRRSADNLGETRRLQKEEWNAPHGAATTESIPSRAMSINVTAGMSHALMARVGQSALPSPVPTLPDWARSSNLSLHHSKHGQNRSVDLNKPDGIPSSLRAVDMGRAASHDASTLMQRTTSRPMVMARGVSGPARGPSSEHQPLSVLPQLQFRQQQQQGRLPRSLASPMTPISPQWPRSAHTLPDDCISPVSNTSFSMLHRSSISSAASDSASSGISSVPQTPISRKIALSGYSHEDDEIEMTIDDEENLLSAMGLYGLEGGKNNGMNVDRFGRIPHTMTPRPLQKRSPHVASLFDSASISASRSSHYKSSSSSSATSATSIRVEEKEGNSTVKANRIQTRPRASTTSSVQSPTRPKTSPEAVTVLPCILPESPNRSSSLQNKASRGNLRTHQTHRDSTFSSHSVTSAASSQSHSESLLSYTRGSPSSSASASPNGSPSEAKTTSTRISSSHRKRTTSKAEDWASSIGRRFTKGVSNNNTSSTSNPMPPISFHSDKINPLEA